jgi:group I intron endonuclease
MKESVMPVIYKATNTKNGKSYIGFTTNFKKRKKVHEKRKENPNCQYFHNAINKHGIDAFDWQILKENATLQDEINFIAEYESFWETGKGYNLTKGGEGSLGRIVSEQTKEKHRQNAIKRYQNEEYKKKISETTKNGMRNWWEDLTNEQKFDHIERCKKKPEGYIKPSFKHTNEAKKRMSESRKGKKRNPFSQQHKQNMSLSKQKVRDKYIGPSNVMSKPDIKEKQKKACQGRKKMYREDGTWYWGKVQ